jgi:hypothetical protein
MVSPGVLWFLSMGIVLDITAVIFMIVGSNNTTLTLHSFLGYSAFLVMLTDVVFIWRVYFKEQLNAMVGKKLLFYSKLAYGWWIIAYITGSILVIWR